MEQFAIEAAKLLLAILGSTATVKLLSLRQMRRKLDAESQSIEVDNQAKIFAQSIEQQESMARMISDLQERLREITGRLDDEVKARLKVLDELSAAKRVSISVDSERMREIESALDGIFNESPIGMVYANVDGKIMKVNRSACDITGYSASELIKMNTSAISHGEDMASHQKFTARLLEGKIATFVMEKRYVTKSDKVVPTILVVTMVRSQDGSPKCLISQIMPSALRHEN